MEHAEWFEPHFTLEHELERVGFGSDEFKVNVARHVEGVLEVNERGGGVVQLARNLRHGHLLRHHASARHDLIELAHLVVLELNEALLPYVQFRWEVHHVRDCSFERLDRDFRLLDFEVDFVSQFVFDRDWFLEWVGESDFLGTELAQLDWDVLESFGFEFVGLEDELVPEFANGFAEEAQGAFALERLEWREVQFVLLRGPGFQDELRLAEQPLALHDDVEGGGLGARVMDLDRELDHLLLVALERDGTLRVRLFGDHFDHLPPVLAGIVGEGDAPSQLARHEAEHEEFVELVLSRFEHEFGFTLDAWNVRLYLVSPGFVAFIVHFNAALNLGSSLAVDLDVFDGPGVSCDAVDFVANDFSCRLVFDDQVGGPLADPRWSEGQRLVVVGAPAHGEVAAARETLGVVVHFEFTLHVVVRGGLVDDGDRLRDRHACGASHLQLLLGHRGDHVHLQLHQPDVQRVVHRLECHESVEYPCG